MTDRPVPQPKLRSVPSFDTFAWARCRCRHLVYRDDVEGGECRWKECDCADHRKPDPEGGDAA